MRSSQVWKYEIEAGRNDFDMPVRARLLHVAVQNEKAVLWALVQPGAPLERRSFHLYGTGWDFDASIVEYVGTFQVAQGTLVFHLFELTVEDDER